MASLHNLAKPASGLVRILGGVLMALALAALVYFAATVDRTGAGEVLRLDVAQFIRADAAPRQVLLPHTWARDGLPNDGRAMYRFRFELDAPPSVPWALSASRLSSRHVIRVNGHWAHGAPLDGPVRHRGAPVVTWVDLPPSLFRAGLNDVDIEVVYDLRAGVSQVLLGPGDALSPAYLRAYTLWVTVPLVLNVFSAGLALFMVSIWWRRRTEGSLGTFAGLLLLISVRNVAYTGTGTVTHTPLADLWFYLAQVFSAVLLARFALGWAGRDWRWFRRGVDVGGGALAIAGVIAAGLESVQALRVAAYPFLIASLVPSLWLMVLGARREAGGTRLALFFGVFQLCMAPVHDYFYLRGLTSVTDSYWLPFAAPVAMLIFAWAMLDRFVGALDAVEGQAAELERRVVERTAELATANAAKTRFLAAASHDLRQPVVSISLLWSLLREQISAPGSKVLVQRIGDSVAALNNLLSGLLDLSRFDAGVVKPRREAVPLKPLLEAVLADERVVAQRKGLELRLRTAAFHVLTDRPLLEQIVRNLVGNAVRYTDRGGVLVAVRRRAGASVRLQVWDTGRGIPLDRQDEVFEEFVQLEGELPEGHRGLGLGLALVRRAAQLLDAPLRLRSHPQRGSCFELVLPLTASASPAARQPAAAMSGRPLAGRSIWVVDDEPDVRAALTLRLQGWGADVRSFAASAPCLAAVGEQPPPDLVVTDQRLPDGQGVGLAARLRQRLGAELPILVVTGDTSPHALKDQGSSGLALLHKPFDGPTLLRALQDLLSSPLI